MSTYGTFERYIAQILESFPRLKPVLKQAYQQVNYWRYGKQGFTFIIHPLVKILTPEQWANVENNQECEFFGYYDITPWSEDNLKIAVHRLRQDNKLDIIYYDRLNRKMVSLGTSNTWNYQQGSRLQWVPNTDGILFNDLVDGCHGTRMFSITNKKYLSFPYPTQTIHPDGDKVLTINYKRLANIGSEYGYTNSAKNFTGNEQLDQDGIWEIDTQNAQARLIICLETLMNHQPRPELYQSNHYINHLMYNPTGTQFLFIHRWEGKQGRFSRLYCADANGTNVRLLLNERLISHYCWYNNNTILVWARISPKGDHYYLVNTKDGSHQTLGEGILDAYGDGHPSYSPDRKWVVTDSYPDRARQQHLTLYKVSTKQVFELGRFFVPWYFTGAERCDLHPRWSPDGTMISIDSSHTGQRKSYILDIRNLLELNED
jgi:Tol biopolymer transport system component